MSETKIQKYRIEKSPPDGGIFGNLVAVGAAATLVNILIVDCVFVFSSIEINFKAV